MLAYDISLHSSLKQQEAIAIQLKRPGERLLHFRDITCIQEAISLCNTETVPVQKVAHILLQCAHRSHGDRQQQLER